MKSLKYRILLGAFRLIPVQKIMAMPPAKTQKLFRKAYHGAQIPTVNDPELDIQTIMVSSCPVIWYRHKTHTGRLCIYLVGGGMLKYPKPSQAKEVLRLAKECGADFMLPYYPVVFTGHTLFDVYDMLYELYKRALKSYDAENITLVGGSSGGNLALGMISYINEAKDGLPVPGKVYAGSPGSLVLTEEERQKAVLLEKTDVVMSLKAIENIWEGTTGGKAIPDYMNYLQLGNYTGLKDAYISYGGDEVFAAFADSVRTRLEQYGVHVTLEIADGLYHSYAMIPLVKEAQPGYRNMVAYLTE